MSRRGIRWENSPMEWSLYAACGRHARYPDKEVILIECYRPASQAGIAAPRPVVGCLAFQASLGLLAKRPIRTDLQGRLRLRQLGSCSPPTFTWST